MKKHKPFTSPYKTDYEVVEENRSGNRLYPHTDQLPIIARAVNAQFRAALPNSLAKTDKRAKSDRKIQLHVLAGSFCFIMHSFRKDELRLFPLPDHDLVTRIAVMQHITENTTLGKVHRFHFYADQDFSPEIYLSGKEVIFTDHAIEQFCIRTADHRETFATALPAEFFSSSIIAMKIKWGRAFIIPYRSSMLALTFKEETDSFIITTCLAPNEIAALQYDDPPETFHLHYGRSFQPPEIRTWSPTHTAKKLYDAWDNKAPFSEIITLPKSWAWHRVVDIQLERLKELHLPTMTRIAFQDGIRGPIASYLPP